MENTQPNTGNKNQGQRIENRTNDSDYVGC